VDEGGDGGASLYFNNDCVFFLRFPQWASTSTASFGGSGFQFSHICFPQSGLHLQKQLLRHGGQAEAVHHESKTARKAPDWIKKSRQIRDDLEISQTFQPLSQGRASKQGLKGVPDNPRILEVLNISEAVRQKTGACAKHNSFDKLPNSKT
jgi:hypothetical protein